MKKLLLTLLTLTTLNGYMQIHAMAYPAIKIEDAKTYMASFNKISDAAFALETYKFNIHDKDIESQFTATVANLRNEIRQLREQINANIKKEQLKHLSKEHPRVKLPLPESFYIEDTKKYYDALTQISSLIEIIKTYEPEIKIPEYHKTFAQSIKTIYQELEKLQQMSQAKPE